MGRTFPQKAKRRFSLCRQFLSRDDPQLLRERIISRRRTGSLYLHLSTRSLDTIERPRIRRLTICEISLFVVSMINGIVFHLEKMIRGGEKKELRKEKIVHFGK